MNRIDSFRNEELIFRAFLCKLNVIVSNNCLIVNNLNQMSVTNIAGASMNHLI